MTLQLLDLYIQYIFISCSKVEWEIDRQIGKASAVIIDPTLSCGYNLWVVSEAIRTQWVQTLFL